MANGVFDVQKMMSDQGLSLVGAVDKGVYQVQTQDGKTGTLNVAKMVQDQGHDPSKMDFMANTPDTATNLSPVGVLDRAALSLGNAAGKMSYLKNKFQAVSYDKDKGIVVNNKGVWQTVDPEGLGGGDAWDMTKELVKDAVDVGATGASALISGAGAALGGFVGTMAGPAGTTAGAIAGAGLGGGAAEGLRTSLGRLAGTYSATPEEQLKDIGFESLINLGGEALGVGAKATFGLLGKAFKNLGTHAADASKDIIAESVGKLTGVGPQATRTMLDQPDEVVRELAQAKIGSRSIDNVMDKLRGQQIETAQNVLDEAPKALTRQFGNLKAQLVLSAKDMPATNIGDIATASLKSIEESGLIRKVTENGNTVFKVMDSETAIQLKNQGKTAAILAPNVQQELQPIVNEFNKYTKLGTFKGGEAASTLMDLKKTVNDVYRDSVNASTPANVKHLLESFRADFANNIGQAFDKANLTPQYMSTINLYEKYADSVNVARKMANQDGGAETLVKKIVSQSGANKTFKDMTGDLAELMGKKGSDMLNSISTKESAKSFSPILPRTGLMSQTALAIGTGIGVSSASHDNQAGVLAAGAMAAAGSPRMAMKGIVYGNKFLGMIQGLSGSQKAQLLGDPTLLGTALRTAFTAPIREEATTQSLVQQAQQAAAPKQQGGR